jgi:putative tricarboxylic transport membrane protein
MTKDAKIATIVTMEDEESPSGHKLGITMDKRIDLAVSVATVLLGVSILILAKRIKAGMVPDPLTSRGAPTISGVVLIIGGIIVAVRQLWTWNALPGHLVPEEGQTDEEGLPASWVRAFSIIGLSVLWEWLLIPVGYFFITPIYLVIASRCMSVQSWVKIIAFSIIFTLVVWICFGLLMGARFPFGPLEPWARSVGLIM